MKRKERPSLPSSRLVFFAVFIIFLDWVLQFWSKRLDIGVDNRGISFGVGYLWGDYFRYVLPVLLSVIAFVVFKLGKAVNLYLFFLFIGGVGNMVPRLIWGHVWDYLQIPFLNLWLNLSDVMISFGALSYILVGDDGDTNSF